MARKKTANQAGQVDMFKGAPRQLVPGADVCAPFHRGAEPSVMARESLSEGKLSAQRQRIVEAVRNAGEKGITCDQLELQLNESHQSTSARCRELTLLHQIHHTEAKAKTRTGRMAWLYFAGPPPDPGVMG